MILADTSAWVEFLRGTGSVTQRYMSAALREGSGLACTDVVVMEVLGGARNAADGDRLRRLLYGQEFLAVEGPFDYESAAGIYRGCRVGGETPRGFTDCLIAAVAIRHDAEVLSADADFAVIARHTPLRLVGT